MALHMTAVNKITWHQLEHYMPKGARLTSCYRSSQQQLDFIVKTARDNNGQQLTLGLQISGLVLTQ